MNHLKSNAIFLSILLLVLVCASSALAGSVKGATLVIYNSGRALVGETRSVTLPKGLASVVFKDVPTTLDSTSIRASATGMTVLDLQYSYLPITTRNLLDRYIGKELTVIMPDPADADGRILRKATLVSNADQPIFLVGKEVYVGNYDALLLPELPKELEQEPTLTLTTDNVSAAKRDVLLSYLMGGLTWRADYALSVNEKGDMATMDAWATVDNTSGRGFSNAELKLVAGDVQQVPMPRRNQYAKGVMLMDAEMAAAPSQPVEEQFSQYHVYSVPRLLNLAESGTRQLSLFSAREIAVEQQLLSHFQSGSGQRNGTVRQNVEVSLAFANTEKNGLGRPMPGGLVRVFMPTGDGSQLLAGESRIPHVPNGDEVKLALGRAFDVTVERDQTAFRKLGKNSYEMGWKITVRNGKKAPQKLVLRDSFPGQWTVMNADFKYAKVDAGTIEFDLGAVPPSAEGKGMVITYTVQITY